MRSVIHLHTTSDDEVDVSDVVRKLIVETHRGDEVGMQEGSWLGCRSTFQAKKSRSWSRSGWALGTFKREKRGTMGKKYETRANVNVQAGFTLLWLCVLSLHGF